MITRRRFLTTAALLTAASALPIARAQGIDMPATPQTGDPQLLAAVLAGLPLSPGFRDKLAVVYIDLAEPSSRFAYFGSTAATQQWEIGSLSKTFLGLMLADSVSRGELILDDPIGPKVAGMTPSMSLYNITARQLADHKSGLPRESTTLDFLIKKAQGGDYFKTFTRPNCFTHALNSHVPARIGVYEYSNLGGAFLGHVINAAAGGTTYKALLQARILTPLGLTNTTLPELVANLPVGYPKGKDSSGVIQVPQTIGTGYSPAGGIRTNIADAEKYLRAVMTGVAPGMSALDPFTPADNGGDIGLFWRTQTNFSPGFTYSFHSGLTLGFASCLLIDRVNQKGLIMLTDTSVLMNEAASYVMRTMDPL